MIARGECLGTPGGSACTALCLQARKRSAVRGGHSGSQSPSVFSDTIYMMFNHVT